MKERRVQGWIWMAATALAIVAAGQSSTALARNAVPIHTFGGASDGFTPSSGLIKDAQGNLYGVTSDGGQYGYGAVYRLIHTGTGFSGWPEEIIHSFNKADGQYSTGSLTIDQNGSLYGATNTGGTFNLGTIFRIDQTGGTWKLTTLHNFGSISSDGNTPVAGVVFGPSGLLYGTTIFGGTGSNAFGVVYSVSPLGDQVEYSVIHTFAYGTSDGYSPFSGLVATKAGDLIGTTPAGGSNNGGVAFIMTQPSAGMWTESVIHNFAFSKTDFAAPESSDSLTLLSDGRILGCGLSGQFGDGGIFELDPHSSGGRSWQEQVDYFFGSKPNDPNYSSKSCSISVGPEGRLFGVTDSGGLSRPAGSGTLYELIPPGNSGGSWSVTVLYDFVPGNRGHSPLGFLAGEAKALFGATANTSHGAHGPGTVFGIVP